MKTVLGVLMATSLVTTQNAANTPEAHVAVAKAAAGDAYQNLFKLPLRRSGSASRRASRRRTRRRAPAGAAGPFDMVCRAGEGVRQPLLRRPVRIFRMGGDNIGGHHPVRHALRLFGRRRGGPDHHGGAKFLQDRYKARVVMSGPDWDVIDRLPGTKPVRDMVATDGDKLTLGDTTLTLYITPGHTPGTLSAFIPVRDGARTHLAALWGGTGLNPDRESISTYIKSAQRFDGIVQKAGADIILSNHTDWDGSKVYLPRMASRAPGSPHPYVVGNAAARRYLKVAEECATARLRSLE